jgi:hypothetical protein
MSSIAISVITVAVLTGCSVPDRVNPIGTPEPAPVKSQPAEVPQSPNIEPMDTTKVVGEIQTLEFTLAAATLTTVNTNVSASKNPDGSVNITIATVDGSRINGNIAADLVAYRCADGYSFSANSFPYQPAGGIFPHFKNSNSETVTLANNAFNDHRPGCKVTNFQLIGGSLHSAYRISGAPSFAV